MDGDVVNVVDGKNDGPVDGAIVLKTVGFKLGSCEGSKVGLVEGSIVGKAVDDNTSFAATNDGFTSVRSDLFLSSSLHRR
jgi:hypothetical protein